MKRDSRPPLARAPGSGRALRRSPSARCGGSRQSPLGRADVVDDTSRMSMIVHHVYSSRMAMPIEFFLCASNSKGDIMKNKEARKVKVSSNPNLLVEM